MKKVFTAIVLLAIAGVSLFAQSPKRDNASVGLSASFSWEQVQEAAGLNVDK